MVLQEKVQELANSDGSSSAAGEGAWDFALTTDGSMLGIDGLALGVGYGEVETGTEADTNSGGDDEHMTAFANYSMGPVTFGYQVSNMIKVELLQLTKKLQHGD